MSLVPTGQRAEGPNRWAGDREAESKVVAWYLVRQESHPKSSPVRPQHFQWPLYAQWWKRALEHRGPITPHDLGIGIDEVGQLSDVFVIRSQVAAMEQRVIASAAAERLRGALEELEEGLRKGGAAALQDTVEAVRQAANDADAGLPDGSRSQAEVGEKVVRQWTEMVDGGEDATRVLPMHRKLEDAFGGWPLGKLCALVGRSSEQKTTILRNACEVVAKAGHTALGWTFEDAAEDLAARTISAEVGGLAYRDLLQGRPGADDLFTKTVELAWAAPKAEWCKRVRWMDDPSPKLADVLSKVRREVAKHGARFVTLEYAQLIRPDFGKADTDHWRNVAASLQALAKELDIAIVVALQITGEATRKSEAEDRRPPRLSEVWGGIGWRQAVFMGLCIAAQDGKQSRRVIVKADKMKYGGCDETTVFVDPARDRVD